MNLRRVVRWLRTPRALAAGRERTWRLALLRVAVVGLTATGAGFAAATLERSSESATASRRFDTMAAHLSEQALARLHTYEYGLRGLRGLVAAAGGPAITRRAVEDYAATRDLHREFPGSRGFGVIFRVPQAQEAAWAAGVRDRGEPSFSIRQIAPHEGERDVVTWIEAGGRNRTAIGLDLASETDRRTALQAAARSGEATLTAPISLIQPDGHTARGFLLLLPIYATRTVPADPAARDAATIGWTYTPLAAAEVFEGAQRHAELAIEITDETTGEVFHRAGTPSAGRDDLAWHRRESVFGRTWRIDVRPTAAFAAGATVESPTRAGIAGGGLVALLLLAADLALMALQRRRREYLEAARRSAIVESSEDAIIAETLSGVVIEWNSGAERLFGWTAAEALGRAATDLILPADRAPDDAALRKAVSRGERVPAFDTTRLHRDGHLVDVSIAAAPILDLQGRCVGFAKSLRDIRETQAARRALSEMNATLEQQVEERTARLDIALRDLRAILDGVPSMIGYWDAQTRSRMANVAYARWYGTTPEGMVGRRMDEVLPPQIMARFQPNVDAALRGEAQQFERTIAAVGTEGERHYLVNYRPDMVDGVARGFYVMVHDITEMTRNQQALADAQRENAAILETLHRHAIVSVADRAGRILEVNDGFCRISGYSAEELRGRNHRIVNSGVHGREFWIDMWRTIGRGEVWHGEVCNRAKDGSLYWVDSVIAPFRDADGRIEKIVSIRTDITPIKRLQQEAEAARRRATQANEAKSQFLANMSHEIRTPLNAVIGLTFLLGRTSLSGEQSGFVERIGLAGKALLAQVNDILDLSKIEAAEMRLESVPFSLRDVVSEVSAVAGAQAEAKDIGFAVDLPAAIPDGVVGDPTRVRQVLLNLLTNSVKFTERGEVRLEVAGTGGAAAGDALALSFRVVDTGIGIEPAQRERLFQPFAQADTSTTRRFGGTGLGLSIVHQLLTLMGGSVAVESEPGRGSVFTAHVPLTMAAPDEVLRARAPALPAGDGRALAGLRVLVVDDSEINLEVARRILEGEAAVVELAQDGRAAVERLRAGVADFDLVLMDVQMPVLDGLAATRAIRHELGLATLPVIALTAGMTTGEHARATTAGMNEVVGKPFEPATLLATIRRTLGRVEPPAPSSPGTPARPVAVAAPQAWPAVEGIDAADVARRLSGDVGLFRTLCERFLQDTDGVPAVIGLGDDAGALHLLKGVAGTLGARRVAALAAGLEHARRSGRPLPEDEDEGALLAALAALRAAIEAFLAAAEPVPAAPDDEDDAGLPGADFAIGLATLAQQLRRAELGALDTFHGLAGPLRRLVGDERFRRLQADLEGLRFDDAAALLAGEPVASPA